MIERRDFVKARPASGSAALLLIPLLALLAVFPYLQTLSFGFTLDDANTILGHPGVQQGLSWDDIVHRDFWGRSRFDTIGTWRPLATLAFWCARHAGGGAGWPFHAMNVALYVAFIGVAERLLARWDPSLSKAARWVALACFASLAIHAGVVSYPSCGADLLTALASLAAIALVTCGRPPTPARIALAIGALFCALTSKESSAPIAVLMPLLAIRAWPSVDVFSRRSRALLAAGCALALGSVAAFRHFEMPFMTLDASRALENPLLAVDTPHRLLGALDVLGLYVRQSFTGGGLAPDYSFSEPPILRDGAWSILVGFAVTVASLLALLLGWTRAPRMADAALAFGASYVAISNVFLAASAIADRLFFLPSFWLTVMVAMAADRAMNAALLRRAAFAMAGIFVLFQLRAASRYASFWRDDLTLFTRSAEVYPNVFRTQRNLAHELADRGRHDDAAFHMAAAEAIYARYPTPVPRDAISSAWDEAPLATRLDLLRGSFGAASACAATTVAAARVRSWGDPIASDALLAWNASACPR